MHYVWGLLLIFIIFVASAVMAAEQTSIPDKYSAEMTNHYLTQDRPKAPLASELLPKLPAHQREFVENYVKVKKFKDDALLKELIHPESRKCENEDNVDYYDYLRYFYLHEELPEVFRLQIMKIDSNKQKYLQERLGYPEKPTHVMFIEYGEGENIEGLQRYLREENTPRKRMYELVKCPDAKTLRQFREQMQVM
jgi:hypothetical protein